MEFDPDEEIQHTVFAHKLVADELVEHESARPAVVALGVVAFELRVLVPEVVESQPVTEIACPEP